MYVHLVATADIYCSAVKCFFVLHMSYVHFNYILSGDNLSIDSSLRQGRQTIAIHVQLTMQYFHVSKNKM